MKTCALLVLILLAGGTDGSGKFLAVLSQIGQVMKWKNSMINSISYIPFYPSSIENR